MRIEKILSEFDGLGLEIAVIVPEGNPKGVIQFSHGMAEHKERYYDFMNYLSDHGYVCVIHDHRGHGGSVEKAEDYLREKGAETVELNVFLFNQRALAFYKKYGYQALDVNLQKIL